MPIVKRLILDTFIRWAYLGKKPGMYDLQKELGHAWPTKYVVHLEWLAERGYLVKTGKASKMSKRYELAWNPLERDLRRIAKQFDRGNVERAERSVRRTIKKIDYARNYRKEFQKRGETS